MNKASGLVAQVYWTSKKELFVLAIGFLTAVILPAVSQGTITANSSRPLWLTVEQKCETFRQEELQMCQRIA